jgi:hypothetical protein
MAAKADGRREPVQQGAVDAEKERGRGGGTPAGHGFISPAGHCRPMARWRQPPQAAAAVVSWGGGGWGWEP